LLDAAHSIDYGTHYFARIRITASVDKGVLDYYIAHVSTPNNQKWRFVVAEIRDWTPKKGIHDAEVFLLPELEWPTLIVVNNGIIYPASKPYRPLF